jgi:hypothetical protein
MIIQGIPKVLSVSLAQIKAFDLAKSSLKNLKSKLKKPQKNSPLRVTVASNNSKTTEASFSNRIE